MNSMKKLSLLTMLTLLVGQVGAAAFTPYQVENTSKVLVYWGDTTDTIAVSNNPEIFDGSISGKEGRVLALQTVAFESSDKLVHRDSRATGKVEFESEINTGVDGILLLVSENESELTIETQSLGTQTISMADLKSNSITRATGGDFSLRVEYLGKDFLTTPENPSTSGSFNDTPEDQWYFKYVQRIKNRKVENQPIFEGYKTSSGALTGNFGPSDDITVGEMLKVVLRVSGLDEQNTNLDASLVNSTHWSVGFQNRAITEGLTIMEAVGINPNRTVSRGEFFQALSEAQKLRTATNFNSYNCNITDLDFEDLDSDNPYTQYACILVKDGIISGTDDGYLNLYDSINRAEVAKILNTALDVYVEQPSNVKTAINNVMDLDDQSSSNNGGSGSNGSNTNVSDEMIQSALPSQADRYYEVKSTNSLTIDSVNNSLITLTWTSQGSNIANTVTGDTLLDSITVNNGTILRIKAANLDWENVDYTLEFEEGAITYSDGKVNAQSTIVFNPSIQTSFLAGSSMADDEFGYTSLARVNIGNPDAYNENSLDVSLERGGTDVTNQINSLDFDSNSGVLSFRLNTQWAVGYYEVTLTDTDLNESVTLQFEVMNCGEQGFPCPATGSFIPESTLGNTVIGYTRSQSVTFKDSSKVRESDIEIELFNDATDVSNDVVDTYSNGVLSIRRTAQWASGSYSLTIRDTALNEEETFFFTVTDQP